MARSSALPLRTTARSRLERKTSILSEEMSTRRLEA